jgi:hypothetical protein
MNEDPAIDAEEAEATPASASPDPRDGILQHAANGTLLDAIFNEYGRRWIADDDPLIAALAELHNAGNIDLLALVTPQSIEPYHGPNFFSGQHVYRALIARLQAPAEALMNVVQTLIDAAGQDLMAGLPVEEFAKWCSQDPGRPAELLALVDAKIPNADRFLTIAIKQGVDVDRHHFLDRAFDFLNGNENEARCAINALGQTTIVGDADWERLLHAFAALLETDPEDAARSSLITAVARRLNDAPAEWHGQLTEIGVRALESGGDLALDSAATALAFDGHSLPPELRDVFLDALLGVRAANKGTLRTLGLAMMKMVEHGDASRARRFVERILRREEDRIELEEFDSLCYKLKEVGGQTLEDWVIAWLLDGDRDLCSALDHDLFDAGSDEFIFDVDFTRFGLREADIPYLARKAIATFLLKPSIAASILVSLLRTAPTDATDEVVALLIDPLLMNYGGIAEDYLKPVAANDSDPAQRAVQRALDGQAAYIAGLRSAGNVSELHPSAHERQLEWQRHSDQMSEAMRAARKKSILASLATESIVLYGASAVSWFKDHTDERRRIETPMASIGHSIEIPRVDIVDPIGLQIMRLQFRAERRPE